MAAFLSAVIALASRNVGLPTGHEHALAIRKDNAGERETDPGYGPATITRPAHRPGPPRPPRPHPARFAAANAVARLVRDGRARRVQACMRALAGTLPGASTALADNGAPLAARSTYSH